MSGLPGPFDDEDGGDFFERECPDCLGTGCRGVDEGHGYAAGHTRIVDERPCPTCKGSGRVKDDQAGL